MSFSCRRGFRIALEVNARASSLKVLIELALVVTHKLSFRECFKHALVVRKLSRLENVDQAGACGDIQAFLLERVASVRLWCASFLVPKVLIELALVVSHKLFISRVFQACACECKLSRPTVFRACACRGMYKPSHFASDPGMRLL